MAMPVPVFTWEGMFAVFMSRYELRVCRNYNRNRNVRSPAIFQLQSPRQFCCFSGANLPLHPRCAREAAA
jgi:hypothetical protein